MAEVIFLLDVLVLWIHLFSAVLFVGGSFFMWLVTVPASHLITDDEAERTRIVGKIARAFGNTTMPVLVVLCLRASTTLLGTWAPSRRYFTIPEPFCSSRWCWFSFCLR